MNDASAVQDESCRVFGRLESSLAPASLNRFIVGEDTAPTQMSGAEILELGDPFAKVLLVAGVFPKTPAELFAALDRAIGKDDPLRKQMSFVVGEGSQIPMSAETARVSRNLRFIISRGTDFLAGPSLIVSVSHPQQTAGIELMAWDEKAGGFNYYTTVGDEGAWVFAGNSIRAVAAPTEGKGPFESHLSGAIVMKELRSPWINWHSPDANILPGAFAPNDDRRTHPWFTEKEPLGAVTCEAAVARPSMVRWAKARFEASRRPDGSFASPRRVLRQIVGTPTANLVTSHIESRKAVREATFDLPQTFFIDSESLTEILGLKPPPPFSGVGSVYAATLEKFSTRLHDGKGFVRPGDTHFAFLVPERAFEDIVVLREALDVGLLTPRLAASLLMTDFPNPIFSARREALLAFVPERATIGDGANSFSQQIADAILAAADQSPDGSPEREFRELWNVGDDFVVPFSAQLDAYYDAVTARLPEQDSFDAYYRLAETRRREARRMPIFSEFSLLFAETDGIRDVPRSMRRDGTVEER